MNAMRMIGAVLGLSVVFVTACDTFIDAVEQGAPPAAVEQVQPPAERSVALVRILDSYAACCSECLGERSSDTNKETCKLNCEGVALAAGEQLPGGPAGEQFTSRLRSLGGCIHACHEDRTLSATDRETCVLTCEGAAEVAATAPPASP